ncbi:hypothetical protein HETIRDRAFT_321302 [Heterobasidion irregulare TC 32-1]|uniref:Uncharacterized protein n=1 Tax=Heterobasidion irregulare (strain TC 32-1) TaxID=747525 RepID=W4K6P9_HETIT|nr:uncharacterized protein HETIRDRAFT_321302 [Heterobasidion irregulare TC 32-1]ETW80736.1 hypothetical protein HETIRDRAFT_321302 [Heterobasidion irregulare TC 32-1]
MSTDYAHSAVRFGVPKSAQLSMVMFPAGFSKIRLFSGFRNRAFGSHAEVFEKKIVLPVDTTRRSQRHRRCAIPAKPCVPISQDEYHIVTNDRSQAL